MTFLINKLNLNLKWQNQFCAALNTVKWKLWKCRRGCAEGVQGDKRDGTKKIRNHWFRKTHTLHKTFCGLESCIYKCCRKQTKNTVSHLSLAYLENDILVFIQPWQLLRNLSMLIFNLWFSSVQPIVSETFSETLGLTMEITEKPF